MDLSNVVIPSKVESLFTASYDILFNTSYELLKEELDFKNLQPHEYLYLLFQQIKTRSNKFNFEIESERDDLDGNNTLTLTFNDRSKESPNEVKKSKKVTIDEEEETVIIEPETVENKKKKSVKGKSGNKKKSVKGKADENKKAGRPKMGKTIWKDVIIKSSDEWQEANSFIKNFLEELDDLAGDDAIVTFHNEQITLLKEYDNYSIISKIYRMVESSDYKDYLKGVYKKNESVLSSINDDIITSIHIILEKEIKTDENKEEIESLVKENNPSELSMIK
jgi:hypothetical protein